MKKILFLIFVIAFAKNGKSQVTYFHYLNYSSEWRYLDQEYNVFSGFDTKYTTTYFDSDTTINNRQYYKEFSVEVFNNGTPLKTGPFFIREDSVNNFLQYSTITNSETVLFNNQTIINSIIGDPFPPTPLATTNCTVSNIDTTNFMGNLLRHVYGNYNIVDPNTSHSGSIEGIGYAGFPCGIMIEGSQYLCFYTKLSDTLKLSTTTSYSLFPSAQRLSLATNNKEEKKDLFTLSPNPSNGVFEISNISEAKYTIDFINSIGQPIYSIKLQNLKEVVDLADKNEGVYYYVIKENNLINYCLLDRF